MIVSVEHCLLATGRDFHWCEERVRGFFASNLLVRYDRLEIDPAKAVRGDDPEFFPRIEAEIEANRRVLRTLIAELEETGVQALADLAALRQGYQSKLLHTLTHLVDGFFGIDSRFYDLDASSHWLDAGRRRELEARPERAFLVYATGKAVAGPLRP